MKLNILANFSSIRKIVTHIITIMLMNNESKLSLKKYYSSSKIRNDANKIAHPTLKEMIGAFPKPLSTDDFLTISVFHVISIGTNKI